MGERFLHSCLGCGDAFWQETVAFALHVCINQMKRGVFGVL
jgi:hypothetical protein